MAAGEKFNHYLVEDVDIYHLFKFQIDPIRIESTRFFSISKNSCACARVTIFISNFFCLSWTDINDISKNQNDIHPGKQKAAPAHNWVPVINLTANEDTVGILNLDIHVVCVTRHMGPLSTRSCVRERNCVAFCIESMRR